MNPTAIEASLNAALAAREGLNDVRREAADAFARSGLPHRRVEGWRWSDFRVAARESEGPAARSGTIEDSAFAALDAVEIRLTDEGAALSERAVASGLTVSREPAATPARSIENPFAALNVAVADEIVTIDIAPGAKPERSVLIRDRRTTGPSFTRMRLKIGAGAEASLAVSLEAGSSLNASLIEIALGEGARLDHAVLSDMPGGVSHALYQIALAAGADYRATALSTGAELTRIEMDLAFDGPQARAGIDTAALVGGGDHADFTTRAHFRAPGCEMRQRHKGVARSGGRAIFQGKFLVDRPAQKTDAKMTANALLLSDAAEANHKPELEIYADDVECAHGSTVGSLDADALFYLRQRGLDEAAARALLIEAFVGELIEAHPDERTGNLFRARLAAWLSAGG